MVISVNAPKAVEEEPEILDGDELPEGESESSDDDSSEESEVDSEGSEES